MNHGSIIRVAYIQNYIILNMKLITKHDDSAYDYSGLLIDDEDF